MKWRVDRFDLSWLLIHFADICSVLTLIISMIQGGKKLRFIALENNLKVLKVTFQVGNYSSSMIDKQFNVISQWTMGESLSMQISIDRYTLRCQVFIKKPIQRGLQRWVETRNRFAVALLAIASRHSTARCLRDAQRNYPRHGIVSNPMKTDVCKHLVKAM